MISFDDFSIAGRPIDISGLLSEIEIPTRLINILKDMTFYSEDAFFQMADTLALEHTSHYLFPNRFISFYPQVMERYANNNLTCNLSGVKIKKG